VSSLQADWRTQYDSAAVVLMAAVCYSPSRCMEQSACNVSELGAKMRVSSVLVPGVRSKMLISTARLHVRSQAGS